MIIQILFLSSYLQQIQAFAPNAAVVGAMRNRRSADDGCSNYPTQSFSQGTTTHRNAFRFPFMTDDKVSVSSSRSTSQTIVEQYFAAWNKRNMDEAAACFTEDAEYNDTAFPQPLQGKEQIEKHLYRCAGAFPDTFKFVIDDLAVDRENGKIGAKWHVENGGEELPFTRGTSFYTLDLDSGLIQSGFDVVEPAVIKPGDAGLTLLSQAAKIIEQPVRIVPLVLWGAYMYVVFFSEGILPGANALVLEQRTWEEVLNLSLNFFLVAPILNLPFSPVVHPGLEGIFNLLLSWAAMFAGFLSDERDDKKNLMPMLPTVAGMQFLTSAFLLPYLGTRESETEDLEPVFVDDLGAVARAFESKAVGPFLGSVGLMSIVWAFVGRPEFGGFNERYSSLIDLLSIDRVGSSFLVDLAIFALFQGWLVDDDMTRRGVMQGEMNTLKAVAKYVPFFGMAAYLFLRPALPSKDLDLVGVDE
uniref:SnoaL-like domain-containing protein n=1 Tax=Leptocylindrus danicus TaxID=163516 RepID=A0A7S2KCK2_9STRA|mmetsp:Transcript_21314/g.31842  ORF Transcript_21314/g.31842 Transcript_21314/m.31842 type:complete len:471 (+) Transcript_21314:128-1540(+)